jgi:hypothetical protein
MLEDIIVLVALAILLLALIWLRARMMSAVRLQRAWVKGWSELARQFGMTFNGGSTRSSITGMYRGRIIYMLGTFRAGMALQVTTTNYASNTLVMKASPLPPTLRAPDEETLFVQGFRSVSGSDEFLERLFISPDLRKRLAPLARISGLVINLNGEELSLTAPRLYTQPAELLCFLDGLSELACAIEAVR